VEEGEGVTSDVIAEMSLCTIRVRGGGGGGRGGCDK